MSSDLEPQLREDSPLYHDALRISIKTPSFYRHDVFLVDEDDDVEFKGHLAFSYEQLPVKAKRLQTKRHISSVANGMLNNEKGGIILMGVHDDKRIEGFTLSRAQQQHIVLSIVDTFNRFTPPVPKHFYDISFIEIIDGREPKDPLMKTLQLPPVKLQLQLGQKTPVGAIVKSEIYEISSRIFKDEDGSSNLPPRKEICRTNAPAAFFNRRHGEIRNTNCLLRKPEKATTG